MTRRTKTDICPVKYAGSLDNKLRKIFQNPQKILGEYINEGMSVLDMGCGPGFFSIEIAKMVGSTGKVIAADLQKGMLDIVAKKIAGTELVNRIQLHQCSENEIGITDKVDFALAIYMVHEVKNIPELFFEFSNIIKEGGKLFILEPKFHVSKKALKLYSNELQKCGFKIIFEKITLFQMNLIAERI
jgi:ubiquinone/menaquinone biosynthesis C-methylase UbiE